MLRYVITAIFSSFLLPAPAQDVLYITSGTHVTVTAGATVTVQGGVLAVSGSSILNNGVLYLTNNSISNQSDWTDKNPAGVFGAGSTGMVTFQSPNGHIIAGNTVFPSLTLDAAGGIIASNDISVANNLLLKTGQFTTDSYKIIMLSDLPDAVQADATNSNYTNSWVNGTLRRSIASNTGLYDFPVGNSSRGNLLQFINNNLTGISSLTASFGPKPGNDAGLIVTENGAPYTIINEGGVWHLDADNAPTAGNYVLQLYFNGFTGLTDNRFAILRRADPSSNAADWIVPAGSAVEPTDGAGRKVADGYARRKNITTFSQLGIGMSTIALPVTLLNFFAARENKFSVTLGWSTATEQNNKGFEIERRYENESQFSYKGFEASKGIGGNSQMILNYTYNDMNAFSGVTYYRIKQLDLDNHFVYSAIKAVNGTDGIAVDVTITPNPSRGQFAILISGANQSRRAFISNINGKVIKELLVQPQHEVNAGELPAATYVLTIIDAFGKGKNFREKIVIVR